MVPFRSSCTYIKNELPHVYREAYKFLEPMDFINFRLTGKARATPCSFIGILSIDNRRNGTRNYNPSILALSGIDRDKLPDLLPVEGIVGNIKEDIANDWGISLETTVISGANDNASALIGSGAIADYEAVAVLGTSGMLMFHYPHKKADILHNIATMPGALNNRNMCTTDTGNTGKVVDYFLQKLVYANDEFANDVGTENMYNHLNQAISQVAVGSDNLLFLP
jgi:xylulokinase